MTDLPTLDIEAIRQMAEFDQWVCWVAVKRGDKLTKIPIDPKTERQASVSSAATWGSFAQAYDCFISSDRLDGIGFVFGGRAPFTGVDLDNCLDSAGKPNAFAQDILKHVVSYTELSPSGKGLHIICDGEPPGSGRRTKTVEVYHKGRFFTLTGRHLIGTPENVKEAGAGLAWLYATHLTKPAQRPAANGQAKPGAATGDAVLSAMCAEIQPAIDATAMPPLGAINLLLGNVPVTTSLWFKRNSTRAAWSPSEWDLSLANYLVVLGWPAVEIAATLIAYRRVNDDDLKLRDDYYARTILRALDNPLVKKSASAPVAADTGNVQLDHASEVFGVRISRVIKYLGDPPVYKIHTAHGTVTGSRKLFTSQTTFRESMVDAANILVPKLKERAWLTCAAELLQAIEEIDLGEESTEGGYCRTLIEQHLKFQPAPVNGEDVEVIDAGAPFIRKGLLFITLTEFRDTLIKNMGERIAPAKLNKMLVEAGCKRQTIAIKRKDGTSTTRSVWQLPKDLWNTLEVEQ